jgi:hypothetical protein
MPLLILIKSADGVLTSGMPEQAAKRTLVTTAANILN